MYDLWLSFNGALIAHAFMVMTQDQQSIRLDVDVADEKDSSNM